MGSINTIGNGVASAARGLPRQTQVAFLVLIAVLALALVMSRSDAALVFLWFLGMATGFTLQRSRFCFASAFRDIFLFGNSRIMKAIIVGLGISTIGFGIHMFNQVPFPEFGVLPSEAHILPVGVSTIVGGLLFGFGMVLAGGCVSGSLYRMAEGYVASWVTIGGVIIGLGLLSQTWNWWWNAFIANQPRIWLPSSLGYAGAIALTLFGLLAIFMIVLWWEARSGLSGPKVVSQEEAPGTYGGQLSALWNTIFVRGWSAVVGGAVLGVIGLLMYLVHMPLGVTGELARWSNVTMSTLNFAAPQALGLGEIGGCSGQTGGSGIFTHTFAVTVGVFAGSLVGALFAREFKVRFPRNPRRYFQSLGGGVIMGYGAGLAIGCTVGAFFSSIPSLGVSGWLFALALAGGSFVGVQVIKRIA